MVNAMARRSDTYRLFGTALQWPTWDFSRNVRQALGGVDATLQAQLEPTLEDLAMRPLDRIQGEYTSLFINNLPHTPCPPYESVYRNDSGLLGPAAEQVNTFYAQWGMASIERLPDHIAVELEFMYLILSGAGAAEGRERDELLIVAKTFFERHLGRWADAFAQDLKSYANLRFYRTLGALLFDFIQAERALWGDQKDLALVE